MFIITSPKFIISIFGGVLKHFFICEGSDLELTVQHGCGLGVNLTFCYNHMAIDLFTVPPACKNFL